MDGKIKRFIEENKDLIGEERFGDLYRRANMQLQNIGDIGDLSEILESAGVYPLKSLIYIPSYYMYGARITDYKIPDSIKYIYKNSFGRCIALTHVIIPCTVKSIDNSAFYKCSSLTNIEFTGTIDQWEDLQVDLIREDIPTNIIHCIDGTAILR